MRYADIVLPLAQPLYTFAVAEGVTLCEGMAVVVPFGRSKIYTGIVWRSHDRRPDFKTVKTVSRVFTVRLCSTSGSAVSGSGSPIITCARWAR